MFYKTHWMSDIIWHQLPKNLCDLICAYVGTDRIKPWVNKLWRINYIWLSQNPEAMHLIELNQDKINWGMLSINPSAIALLLVN